MTGEEQAMRETTSSDTTALREELEQFSKEKEEIRALVGQIGGTKSNRRDRAINIVFLTAIGLLFVADVLRHLLHTDVPLPPLFSIELGVLLVSVKIVWMIHKQSKVEHFQFWILNSIEFRLNEITKTVRRLEDKVGR
jgi:hypothetical protein